MRARVLCNNDAFAGVAAASALFLVFAFDKAHAFEANRYNYRDHPDYKHVADYEPPMYPAPAIDCEADNKDDDAQVVEYLVRTCKVAPTPVCARGDASGHPFHFPLRACCQLRIELCRCPDMPPHPTGRTNHVFHPSLEVKK
jgi:hypothetical protein